MPTQGGVVIPIIGQRVTVTTTASRVVQPTYGSVSVPITASILNLGTADVDLGGIGVVAGAGYLLRVGGTLDVDLTGGDDLYGVTASGTATLCVLKLRQ